MFNRFVIGTVVMAAGWMIAPVVTRAALVVAGGASLYSNSLESATMSGEIGGGGSPSIGTPSVISAPATEFTYNNILRYQGSPTTSSITATLAGSANVGTIISVINYPGPSGTAFSNAPDWAFSINGSPVDSGTWGLSTASNSYGGIQITTLASPQSATSVKMGLSNVPYYAGDTSTHYADYHYLVALPDSVVPVTTLSATSSTPGSGSFLPGNTIVYATDPINALETSFYSTDDPGFLQISLGGTKQLAGVLLATYPGPGGADLIIKDDLGFVVGTLTGTPNASQLLPIKFNSPVTTSYLRFESVTGTGLIALNEVIPLVAAEVPEPASLGLLSIGAAAMMLRRRARG